MSMPATRHRFTVDDWHRMIEAGLFGKDQRIELLDGEIREMTPIGPPHQSVATAGRRIPTRPERGQRIACEAFPAIEPVDDVLG